MAEKAASSSQMSDACREIKTALADKVSFPGEPTYKKACNHYWSKALRQMRPACVVSPTTAQDVSAAIKVLAQYPKVPFVVRSGGHDPNPGHASTDGGILVSLTAMKGATYDKESGLAFVKPGGQWNDVIKDLEPHGVTIVGGRLGIVGVGGYLVQGGVSFLSAQYGLAADNIVGWEVVSGDGSIVNVSADAETQSELAVAMRGSGSQFGIVTQFKVKTYPIGKVWGGGRLYSKSKRDEVLALVHKIAPHEDHDPKAAIIYSDSIYDSGKRLGYIYVFLFYDAPEPPPAGPFADLLKIPSVTSDTKSQTYTELLLNNGKGADALPYRYAFRTLTMPYIPSRPGMYKEIIAKALELTGKKPSALRRTLTQISVTFQPFPKIIGEQSERRGGNAMGLGSQCPDRIILEVSGAWWSGKDDELMYNLAAELVSWVEAQLPAWMTEADMAVDAYMPFFMNDATWNQKVTASYREYEKLKVLQEKFDPTGMFRSRVGGHKY